MHPEDIPGTVHPLFKLKVEAPIPDAPSQQNLEDRQGETKRIVKRLATIIEDHRQESRN